MISLKQRVSMRADRGSALVSAVAVAIIGMAISAIVVTQAVMVTNDSARDRVRTIEVHSAESGLDSVMSELATTSPCPGPAWSPLVTGSGTTATEVTVEIEYSDTAGPLTCTAGVLSGTPTSAVITSTSRPVHSTAAGIAPERVFQAKVKLKPQSQAIPGAALFAATEVSTGGGFSVQPQDPANAAGVWLDSGNFNCNTDVKIDGSLYVVAGSAIMQNGCSVSGDLWAKTGFSNCCTVPNNVWQVGGNLTVRDGNLTLSNRTRVAGDIKVNGTVPLAAWAGNPWSTSTIGGTACATNLPTQCTGFTDFAPVGMPQIHYVLADWQPAQPDNKMFQRKFKADFALAMLQAWNLTDAYTAVPINWDKRSKYDAVVNEPCAMKGWISTVPIQLPADGSSTPTVYDMRDCSFAPNGKVTLKLNADIAIFAKSFAGSNGLTVESATGQPHKVWFIVPWGGGANGTSSTTITVGTTTQPYDPGPIYFDTGLTIKPEISAFLYTPEELRFPNTSNSYGQLYGGKVRVGQGNGKFYYAAVGVPGVDLSIPTSTAVGFKVEIESKQELTN